MEVTGKNWITLRKCLHDKSGLGKQAGETENGGC